MHTLCCLEYEGGRGEVKGKGERGEGGEGEEKGEGDGIKYKTKKPCWYKGTNPQTTSVCIQLVG